MPCFFACQGVHVCADQLGNVVFIPPVELVGKTGEAPQILFGSNFLDGNSHGSSVIECAKYKKNEMLPIVDNLLGKCVSKKVEPQKICIFIQ